MELTRPPLVLDELPEADLDEIVQLLVRQQGGGLKIPLALENSVPGPWHSRLAALLKTFERGEDDDDSHRRIRVVDVPGSPTAIRECLTDAYRELRSGDLVLLVAQRETSRSIPSERSWRDVATTELFRAGFDNSRAVVRRRLSAVVASRGALPPPTDRPGRLSVVLPVYNEIATFGQVIDALLDKEIPDIEIEVVLVESNSNDGTRAAVLALQDHPRVRVVLENEALGKGHAVRAGIESAKGDYLLIQDADLEYDLGDYERLLAPLRQYEASFVLGVRTSTLGARWGVRHFAENVASSHVMNLGHILFLRLFNFVYRAQLEDPFTMYKVLRRDCLNGIKLECNRFDFDWELVGKLLRMEIYPLEIPVLYHSRSFSEGKKISVIRDPLTWLVACFKHRFSKLEQ